MRSAGFVARAVLAIGATLLLGACSGMSEAPESHPDSPRMRTREFADALASEVNTVQAVGVVEPNAHLDRERLGVPAMSRGRAAIVRTAWPMDLAELLGLSGKQVGQMSRLLGF
jgi:hypothetical protein